MSGTAPSFQVIPAVDVLGGVAVRLERGDFSKIVARESDPEALVARFVDAGARMLHVVDLNGAREGITSPALVRRLARAASPAQVQVAGGVRSPRDAVRLLEAGAVRVVVGTAAFRSPHDLREFRAALDGKLVVAIDVRGDRVATCGWTEMTGLTAEEAAGRCAEARVARVLCTAVERDGTLAGPDLDLLVRVRSHAGVPVLAAGGVGSTEDLEAVAGIGCEGAIVGRALLDGRLPLSILSPP
jgi:phosphoribosylformimino-5-aminoimidazole carboxamide ribotide isomerase